MTYTIHTNGITLTVDTDTNAKPNLVIEQHGESVVLFGYDLDSIKAIRRAMTDIIDADKRRTLTTNGGNK